jgi:hypothetical protein
MKPLYLAWGVAAAVVALAGFFAGQALRSNGNAGYAFTTEAAAYVGIGSPTGLSQSGFSGFADSGGLEGRTVLAGSVVSVSGSSLTIETASGGQSTIRLTGDQRLRRLDAGGRDLLRPGTTVALRRGADGLIEAVLVVAQP